MIVTDIGKRCEAGIARIEARVEWENADTPPITLFVETEERFADALLPDPNALLVACALPAWRVGERRVRVEGTLCPLLCERLNTPLKMIQAWSGEELGPPPSVEASRGYEVKEPIVGRSVALLSCGIDSLATLRWNVTHVPPTHPDAIEACVYFAVDDHEEPSLERLHTLTGPRAPAVNAVTADAGVEAIPVRTNLWWLVDEGYFFMYTWHGAFLATLVSVLGGRFGKGYIASSDSPTAVLPPWGSHPMLDPYYSSGHFRIEHDLFGRSRKEKVALVAEWPVGLANIRVCQNDDTGSENCGTCEKCIRTQLQLAGLGKLEAASASFDPGMLTSALVATIDEYGMVSGRPTLHRWYGEFVPQLKAQGYFDIATALEEVLLRPTSADSPPRERQ